MERCKVCTRPMMRLTEYGTMVCTDCGCEDFSVLLSTEHACIPYSIPLHTPATYTRVKRFRKYLQRASMNQSASTIPEATWAYLLEGAPYRRPGNIIRRLKKAPKDVRKKCYDSLPLLVQLLCPHIQVPRLTETDKMHALLSFNKLDAAYCAGEPFVSYLFALEYILILIGRKDMLPFINKICCRKRRAEYQRRLDRVFADQ
jgi:hypothetical protein